MPLLPILASTLLLAACGVRNDGPFHGVDLSDASYGRSLELDDTEGRARSLAEFGGRYVLISFGYTHCPEVCPLSLLKAAQVRRALGADGERLQVLFVTVDPERDTGAILEDYVGAFDPDFIALRGDEAATRRAARSFRVTYRKVPTENSYAMDHTMVNYLVGPDGRLRLAFQYDQAPGDMVADIRLVMQRDAG
nr:SCO family protein [Luteimonas sp. BDR2-5]